MGPNRSVKKPLFSVYTSGVDVGNRWDELFEKSRPYLDDPDHYWTFADGHLMFAACHNPKYKDVGKKFLESAKKFVRLTFLFVSF